MLPALEKTTGDRLSDADMAAKIAAGDHAAFTVLMRRYNRPLYRTARSIVKDDADAEDVLQDAYLLAYRGIRQFRGDASLRTWLTRIVVNEAVARLRKTARRAQVIQFGDAEWDADAPGETMDETRYAQPEHAAMRAEARSLIEKKIDDLPDAFRTVFVLRALEELSVEEVAASLDIREATVRTRYFRAKSLLREALSREIDIAFEDAFAFAGARCDRIVAGVLRHVKERSEGG